LALQYSKQGKFLGILGRDRDRLEAVAVACRELGAHIVKGLFDLENTLALNRWMRDFDAAHPIDLLIVNAGQFTGHGPDRTMESLDDIVEILRSNLEGAANFIAAALPMMRARRRGRIAIIGSLAALQPLADAPAYSASKAGLMAYGEALREWLIPEGVAVSLIFPGHINTRQVANHVGSLPLLTSPEAAAALIKAGLDRGRSSIFFPRRLLWLIRVGRLVPWPLRARFGRGLRFHVSKDITLQDSQTQSGQKRPVQRKTTSSSQF
jgi:short-subunit dehydrogenase